MAASTEPDRHALASMLDQVVEVIDRLAVTESIAAMYEGATTTANTLMSALRAMGDPNRIATDRGKLEHNLILQWLQLTEQYASQVLAVTVQQAAQIARLPKGPQVVDMRGRKLGTTGSGSGHLQ